MKKNILLIIAGIFLMGACGKKGALPEPEPEPTPEPPEEVVDPVTFDVTTDATSYKVGDEVTFKFKGEADELSFYSGEFLHAHEFHATDRISKSNSIVASFRTNIEHGATPRQPDQVSVFVSTDYNGGGTYADVTAAIWKGKEDFSTWFALAPHDNLWQTDVYLSGNIELVDAFEENKPLYLAFRYQNKKNSGEGGVGYARRWFAYSFNLTSTLLSEINPLYTNYLGFSFVYGDAFDNDELKTSFVSESGALMEVKLPVALRQVETELWAISPAINLEEVNHGPDTPKAVVKEVGATMPEDYKYIFTEPGTYKVSFAYKEGTEEKIKHIDLTITE